jgi:hypothetical protein
MLEKEIAKRMEEKESTIKMIHQLEVKKRSRKDTWTEEILFCKRGLLLSISLNKQRSRPFERNW